MSWRRLAVSADRTHHVLDGKPAYARRFAEVLKFHEPGLAPARDETGAYHIDVRGEPAYPARYRRAFGFYEGRAAVEAEDGFFHLLPDGAALYGARYAWCGNFQGGRCAVRDRDGLYRHIDIAGAPAYPDRWRYAGDYRDGVAVVQRGDGRHTHIDIEGRPIHDRWLLDLDVFHKGFARARDERGWHHVDERGHAAYARRFTAVEPFYNGQARVEGERGELLVIDEAGEAIAPLRPPLRSDVDMLSADLVGVWRTHAIAAAVELGVFDALPCDAGVLAARTGIAPAVAPRLLRALCELGLAAPSPRDGEWEASERGRLLRRDAAMSLAAAARVWAAEHATAWSDAASALRTGRAAFPSRFGAPFFVWLAVRPDQRATYHAALRAYARNDYAALPAAVDLSGGVILDAGGGSGELLWPLLRAFPEARGILMDRPEVIADIVVPEGLRARFERVAGDLFAPWPARADIVFLARVLHDWDDAHALQILRRAHAALPPGGRLLLVELVLSDDPADGRGGLLDLNMLVMTGGRERTIGDFDALLSAADFTLTGHRYLPAASALLEARRA